MCGRFYIAKEDPSAELARIIAELKAKDAPEGLKTSGDIFPTDTVPVLSRSRKGNVMPFAMGWGYRLGTRQIINARSETAQEKPLFRDGMVQRRCIIPASGYYEWEHKGGKRIPYAIRPEEEPTLYLTGIYRLEPTEAGLHPVFTILTQQAAPGIAFIHPRMPVILPKEAAKGWLEPANAAKDILPYALTAMEYRQV